MEERKERNLTSHETDNRIIIMELYKIKIFQFHQKDLNDMRKYSTQLFR